MSNPTKKQLEKFIKHKLATCQNWVIHGFKTVYKNQDLDEVYRDAVSFDDEDDIDDEDQVLHGRAVHRNGVGFSRTDAEILTSIYKFMEEKKIITQKQLAILYQKMPKYWRQIYAKCDKGKLIEQYLAEQN